MEAAEDAEHHHQELEEAEIEVEEREHKPHGKKHGHAPAEDHELEEHGTRRERCKRRTFLREFKTIQNSEALSK